MKSFEQFLALNPGYGETEYLCYLLGYQDCLRHNEWLHNDTLKVLAEVTAFLKKPLPKCPSLPDAYDRIDENVRTL